mmetsp:Transcript_4724/g.17471  ORF Transcript_4724/g.17471 Transcript_4724/m.17471 type:complete len:278 (-) Transcript_4724:407-1240(-)
MPAGLRPQPPPLVRRRALSQQRGDLDRVAARRSLDEEHLAGVHGKQLAQLPQHARRLGGLCGLLCGLCGVRLGRQVSQVHIAAVLVVNVAELAQVRQRGAVGGVRGLALGLHFCVDGGVPRRAFQGDRLFESGSVLDVHASALLELFSAARLPVSECLHRRAVLVFLLLGAILTSLVLRLGAAARPRHRRPPLALEDGPVQIGEERHGVDDLLPELRDAVERVARDVDAAESRRRREHRDAGLALELVVLQVDVLEAEHFRDLGDGLGRREIVLAHV